MTRNVLLDEFHLSFFVPRQLSAAECDALRRTLDDARFRAFLRRAVKRVVRAFPSLTKARVRLSR